MITPEEFMTLHQPDEPEELEPRPPLVDIERRLADLEARYAAVARSQQESAPSSREPGEDEKSGDADTYYAEHQLQAVNEALADLEDRHRVVVELVYEIQAIIKPSTSKLANTVRDAIARWTSPEVPADVVTAEPDEDPAPAVSWSSSMEQPAHDADVEEWRAYARWRGVIGSQIDVANRSMIRTMLGLEHPAAAPGEETPAP